MASKFALWTGRTSKQMFPEQPLLFPRIHSEEIQSSSEIGTKAQVTDA